LFDVVSSGLGTLSNLFATTTIYKSTVFIWFLPDDHS
jgi:hypothetical protein